MRKPSSEPALFEIRRASPQDASDIHDAHMRSIQEVCSRDHSPDEIAAWGHREFEKLKWEKAIKEQLVWAVVIDDKIEGYAHLAIHGSEDVVSSYIHGLYLTPCALGTGAGAKLLNVMLDEAKSAGAKSIHLHSTITAHGFYKKFGFQDNGPQTTVTINGTPIRCFPMTLKL